MNVLLFVTCFLLMLSMLTYAKLDNFRYFLGTQAQFEFYMHKLENSYANKTAKKWYETTIANKQTPSSTQATANKNTPPGPSSPRLGLKILIDHEMQANNKVAYTQTVAWTKELMQNLYGKYPFYQEALKKRSSFVDELLESLKKAVEELPIDKRPKEASELANLTLGKDFDEVFYLMMKGNSATSATEEKKIKPSLNDNISLEETPEDEHDIAAEALESFSTDGYDSLLNYITLQNSGKIRVYLASKEVLQAVFSRSDVAENILQTRYQLYQSVMRGEAAEQASIQFKANFESYMQGNDAILFDFRVSKTNPSKYN